MATKPTTHSFQAFEGSALADVQKKANDWLFKKRIVIVSTQQSVVPISRGEGRVPDLFYMVSFTYIEQ